MIKVSILQEMREGKAVLPDSIWSAREEAEGRESAEGLISIVCGRARSFPALAEVVAVFSNTDAVAAMRLDAPVEDLGAVEAG